MPNLNFAELYTNLAAPHLSHTLRLCNVSPHFYDSSKHYLASPQLSYDHGYVTPQPELDYASPQLLASVPDPYLLDRDTDPDPVQDSYIN
jgi:hypothetical protein